MEKNILKKLIGVLIILLVIFSLAIIFLCTGNEQEFIEYVSVIGVVSILMILVLIALSLISTDE